MSLKDIELYRRRAITGEHIIAPKKPTNTMTEREALEWEKDCDEAWLLITEDPGRKQGLIQRIQEIEMGFKHEKADKMMKQFYDTSNNEKFDNEIEEKKVAPEPEVKPVKVSKKSSSKKTETPEDSEFEN